MLGTKTRVRAAIPLATAFATLLAIVVSVAPAAAAVEAGLGRVSFPNSGAEAAQAAFLRGVAALHSFWYEEAARAFREAERRDPAFALAYWGEAMTANHPLWGEQDREAALAALGKLAPTPEARAAKAPTAREKGFLAAVEALYARDGGSKAERDRAYAAAMERLYQAYPSDLEAAAFYALALQGQAKDPGEHSLRLRMRSAAIAEEIFAANPKHPGAAHYLIHAYDDPIHAPLGLRAARVYAQIAPAAHHALHMPSHIFVQLGLWEDAVRSNEAAWQASADWVKRRGLPVEKQDFHSFSWLQYAELQLGHAEAAAKLVEEARALAAETGSERLRHTAALMKVRQAVETGVWEQPLPLPDTPAVGYGGQSAAVLFGAGVGAVRTGDLEAGRKAAAWLGKLAADLGSDPQAGVVVVMQKELEGILLQEQGRREEALAPLAEAARLEAGLDPPSGPPIPVKPAAELYGEALLALGRNAEAEAQFDAALLRTPNRRLSVLGRARARGEASP